MVKRNLKTNKELLLELESLKKERESNVYQEIINNSYETIEEFESYKQKNSKHFARLGEINSQIKKIKWELMTPEEQEEEEEMIFRMRKKFGSPFHPDNNHWKEFEDSLGIDSEGNRVKSD